MLSKIGPHDAQHHLDDAGQEAFAERFGKPVAHPTVPVVPGSKYLLELDSKEGRAASSWHTDVTFVPAYPESSILRAIVIPQAGITDAAKTTAAPVATAGTVTDQTTGAQIPVIPVTPAQTSVPVVQPVAKDAPKQGAQ